jgi:hypothetical protein
MPMRVSGVSVMRRLLVISGFVMFGRFSVVPGGLCGMFRCLLMVFGSLLGHGISSELRCVGRLLPSER